MPTARKSPMKVDCYFIFARVSRSRYCTILLNFDFIGVVAHA